MKVDRAGHDVHEPWLLNFYRCVNCGAEWDSEWSCACDEDCPMCGTVMTPYDSDELEAGDERS